MGAITPIGLDVDTSWKRALTGVSGVGPITLFDSAGYKSTFAAEVSDWDTSLHFNRKEARRLDRFSEFFVVACRQAIDHAGIDFGSDEERASRAGVMVGAGFGGMGTFIGEIETLSERGPGRLSPTCLGQCHW
jgi:3-oxoacyl-[acyl-carrier-protein] synthase II